MTKTPQINHHHIHNTNNNLPPLSSTLGIRSSFQILTLILIVLVISIFYFADDDGSRSSPLPPPSPSSPPTPTKNSSDNVIIVRDDEIIIEEKVVVENKSECDYFSGKWVYDNENLPKYKEKECGYMYDLMACETFGRTDLSFQRWRWQPHHCHLQRFNGTALLEKLRNKRLMYVGDSLNRNQWISMVCLVESTIPASLKSMQLNGSLFTFKALEYNATIEFYWAPLLVESNSDDPIKHRVAERIARIEGIEKHARYWTNVDLLVFDCYLWWRVPLMKILWGTFESPDGIYKQIEMLKGYEMALKTWSDWLESHINHSTTQIFWMSMSPTHERSEEWGGAIGQNCYNETQPIKNPNYWGSGEDPNMMRLVEVAIEKLSQKGLNIKLLNITQLSQYRKDAHLSINRKYWDPVPKDQLSNPTKYADCFHWCLPGIPDTWNEILFNYIV